MELFLKRKRISVSNAYHCGYSHAVAVIQELGEIPRITTQGFLYKVIYRSTVN